MSLSIQSLTKQYGTQKAVDNLSFDVEGGNILGFLGPNGAGKSTTMKMVSCYLNPTSGTAKVCGYDILENPLDVRKHIGYLPESNPLYYDMYVREYLQFVAGIHNLDNKTNRIKDLIEQTGLGKEQHKLIGALSKGYKQRVGLAQAMIHNPDVLILDEPTSGLDMNQLVDIRSLIKELGKEKTVILSTHIMQEVQALCDRVIIINNGRLVADDPIEKLQDRIKGEDEITINLTNNNIDINPLKKIKGVNSVIKSKEGIVLRADTKKDIRPDIFKTAVQLGWVIIEMKKEDISVEDVFQQLTKENAHA
ncbi:MAG: gliding motility-associated ABC transporter ATP-binding subunit GldA [Saprospiraceae bacterium]|nr:gliding motility-associated ABC transporter ATP-binding subunit GldA [Saprospiraceae bacterium]